MSLDSLPTEILDCILDHDEHEFGQPSATWSLARTSRKFNRLALPRLYKDVALNGYDSRLPGLTLLLLRRPDIALFVRSLTITNENDERGVQVGDEQSRRLTWPHSEDINALLKSTIDEYPIMPVLSRRFLEDAIAGDQGAIVSLLLPKLHNISYASFGTNIEATYLRDMLSGFSRSRDYHTNIPVFNNITRMSIRQRENANSAGLLQVALTLPSVKDVDAYQVKGWNDTLQETLKGYELHLERLELWGCPFTNSQIINILRSCTELKCFAFYPENIIERVTQPSSLRDVISLLAPHGGNLTTLSLYGWYSVPDDGIDLSAYQSLQRLEIQWGVLVGYRPTISEPYEGTVDQTRTLNREVLPHLSTTLTPGLKTLQLWECSDTSSSSWLREVLRHRSRSFPQVERLIMGSEWERGNEHYQSIMQELGAVGRDNGLEVEVLELEPSSAVYIPYMPRQGG